MQELIDTERAYIGHLERVVEVSSHRPPLYTCELFVIIISCLVIGFHAYYGRYSRYAKSNSWQKECHLFQHSETIRV